MTTLEISESDLDDLLDDVRDQDKTSVHYYAGLVDGAEALHRAILDHADTTDE